MEDITLDDRGRFTLPKSVRDRYGDQYRLVELPDGIKLIPISDDPLASLREQFAEVEGSPLELRERARETALDHAGR